MKKPFSIVGLVLAVVLSLGFTQQDDCGGGPPAKSASGVGKATVKVQTGSDGLTIEQRNVTERLKEDNKPGSIKHLYVISAYSGQVIIYSTVRGKVTSSGKRLTPTSVASAGEVEDGFLTGLYGRSSYVDNQLLTTEVLQDDGTYGTSIDYIYWWDSKGIYHQHYVQGGQIVHVASEPLAVKSVVLNMELR